MGGTESLIRLLGAVALLLWGLRMVQTGAVRGFASELRRALHAGTAQRVRAFLTGLGVTAALQSSTATVLLISSFADRGIIPLAASLAVVLGADLGTALIAEVLSFRLGFVGFLLLVLGFVVHRLASSGRLRNAGRIVLGLGMMLVSLGLIRDAAAPLGDSAALGGVYAGLAGEPVLALLVGAGLAWAMHSSLATVLLIASLTAGGAVPLALGLGLMLGANIGGTVPAVTATLRGRALSRRVAWGNMALKSVTVLGAVWIVLPAAEAWVALTGRSPGMAVLDMHVAFNLSLGIVFLPLVGRLAGLFERLIPESAESAGGSLFLDPSLLGTPSIALSAASRENMRMAEAVQTMIEGVGEVLVSRDATRAAALRLTDDLIDELYEDTKLYVTELSREEMGRRDSERASEVLLFATNLEHMGDILESILADLRTAFSAGVSFSSEGQAELEELRARVAANLHAATHVFMSGDVAAARALVEEKTEVNKLVSRLTEAHLVRLRQGGPATVESSAVHLDVLRDLKRVHSHITAVAYPVLDRAGALRKSRLKKEPDG